MKTLLELETFLKPRTECDQEPPPKPKTKRGQEISNWADPYASHQIINQIIIEEFIKNYSLPKRIWVNNSRKRLEKYGITLAPSTIYMYKNELKKGIRKAECASSFVGDLGSRTGKNIMYGQLELFIDLYLKGKDKKYVGLPANQILHIIQKYKNNIAACETNKNMYDFMVKVRDLLSFSKAEIIYEEIFKYLNRTNNKFSIFDLDTMQHIYEEDVEEKVNAICRTMEKIAVVCIVSCVGRCQTHNEYINSIPENIIKYFNLKGVEVKNHFSGSYSDRITPMRYELLAVEKNDE